jgi:hypothetical protein
MLAELPLAHAVRADVQQWRAGLIARTQPVNAEARENDALPRDQDRNELCRRDVWIELEIEAWPAVKTARDVGPFLDRAEAIAHGIKVAGGTA